MKNQDFRRRWFGVGVLIALAFATPLHAGGTAPLKQTKAAKQALWITDAFGFTELEGDQILIAFGGANSEPGSITFDSSGNFWGTFCQAAGPTPMDWCSN